MRKLLLVLPVAAVVLAAGVMFSGLGRSLANTELPDRVATAPGVTADAPAPAAPGEWVETGRKPVVVKSPYHKPNEPYPPGSRRH